MQFDTTERSLQITLAGMVILVTGNLDDRPRFGRLSEQGAWHLLAEVDGHLVPACGTGGSRPDTKVFDIQHDRPTDGLCRRCRTLSR